MKKEKLTISMYECEKCNKTVYFRSNEEINTKCKTCGQEMKFWWTHPYNPKNNIKQANSTNNHNRAITQKTNTVNKTESINHIPKCPTCGSADLRKINIAERGASIFTFGLLSKKINKTFKCNNCGYTW